ncbi:extracellular solute-binding protein family 1 [Candidatus Halobonum tyrrellensis G22]|uniref:Extracellular solute-binding protein family 1 n=2 Tax=Candidatus Halobonum TaxID=1431544 RepID=V4H7Z0_9EURY|nr:extracellular solute-binding protein family 1 [Candidatus Halobonum tyrrellensis G22]
MASSASGWGWNIAARSLQLAAETYNEENGTDISVQEMGFDNWEQQFQTSVLSGSGGPDFSSVQNFDVAPYADKGGLMDLTDRLEEANIADKVVDGKLSTISLDDSYYAIPWDIGPTGVFYNRSVYEEHDIDPNSISTWDQFIEEGKKLPDGVSMTNLPPQDINLVWRMLFRQLGGQPITESGAININSEKSVRVAQLLNDMSKAGITTQIEFFSAGWFTALQEGTVASVASAVWLDGTLRAELPDTAGNWGVYKLPAFEEGGSRASNRGGSNVAIPTTVSDDAVLERAYDFSLWAMTNPEIQNQILQEYGIFPSLTAAYDADFYDEGQEFYDGQAIFSLFTEVAENIKPYRYSPVTSAIDNTLVTELGNMLNGNKSPEDAIQDAAETVAERTDRELA